MSLSSQPFLAKLIEKAFVSRYNTFKSGNEVIKQLAVMRTSW